MTGLTSVHANRMLRELREERVVQIRDRRVDIFDSPLLSAIAEFDDQYLQLHARQGRLNRATSPRP